MVRQPPTSLAMIIAMKYGVIQVDVLALKQAVAIAVLITSVSILFQRELHSLGRYFRIAQPEQFRRAQPILTIFAGALMGFLVTLTSIGAGAVGIVLLTYLYPLRLTPSRLIATDIVHAIPLAIFAGIGHLYIGNIDFSLLGWLLLGSIPGVILGATLSSKFSQRTLRIGIAILLGMVATKLLID